MIVESPGPIRNGRMPGRATGAPTGHQEGREAGMDRRPTGARPRTADNPGRHYYGVHRLPGDANSNSW